MMATSGKDGGGTPKSAIRGRIFVVGCPRSGTTLLQSFLAANPQIVSFPESHFFETVTNRRARLGLSSPRGWERKRLAQFLSELGRTDLSMHVPRLAVRLARYVEVFVAILDRLAIEQGTNFWLEKTPGHVRHIGVIEKYVPGAQFVHILRNGPDVVASLYEAASEHPELWVGPYDLDRCIARWNEAVEISLNYVGLPNHVLVTYEDLVADPERVLRALCTFIGIEFSRDMTAGQSAAARQLILKSETWKAGARESTVRAPEERKFDLMFSPEQKSYVLERLLLAEAEELAALRTGGGPAGAQSALPGPQAKPETARQTPDGV